MATIPLVFPVSLSDRKNSGHDRLSVSVTTEDGKCSPMTFASWVALPGSKAGSTGSRVSGSNRTVPIDHDRALYWKCGNLA